MPPLSKSVIPLSSLSWIYVFCILLPLSACDSAISENHSSEAVESVLEVDVINMQPQSVTIKAQLAGRTVPYLISEVRPQVNGIIKERQFQEGNTVKAGEILYQIDPVIYQATFDSAKAELEKSEANLITTQLKAQRFKNLASSKAISLQDYDDATAAYKQARATVAVDKASLQTAQINLDYTHVSSPISGRIGRSAVTPGALVTANQEKALAVVQQLDPIYVDITQSSAAILRLHQDLHRQTTQTGSDVQLTLENGEAYPHKGKIAFSEVSVDQETGTITLRAVFPNPDQVLLPGMFVRANIESAVIDNAMMVPPQALSRDAKGRPLVMVLNKDKRVEPRILGPVKLVNKQWLVQQGLHAGEQVITSALQQLHPNMLVRVANNENSGNAQQKL